MDNDGAKIISFADYVKSIEGPKKEEKDFSQKFELNFGSYNDVDDFLYGPNSYEYKLRYLQNERNKMVKMIEYIDESKEDFLDSDVYLEGMQDILSEIKKDFRSDAILSFVSSIFGGFFTYEFLNLLISQSGDKFINIIIGLVALGLGAFSIYNIKDTIMDYRALVNYEKQIEKYDKILKRRLQ